MISLPELRAKALRQLGSVLRAHLAGENLFPLPVRASKALDRSQGHAHIYAQQAELVAHSKQRTGYGYSLTLKLNPKTRQSEITRIEFETRADYLTFTDMAAAFAAFEANVAVTTATVPALLSLPALPRLLLDNAADWPALLTVCAYFQQHPQPNEYVRNLPLGLPTKFVEQHQAALRPLLNFLIAEHIRPEEDDFFRRFHLLLEEPAIKVRFLDERLRLHPALSQLSVWASEFRQLQLAGRCVFIIENLTSFLSFPLRENSLAIWGGGFAVRLLASTTWLAEKELFYWGDIDVHGFQILAQLRTHYPAVQSLLMDAATFRRYYGDGRGASFVAQVLVDLTTDEQALYQELLRTNARLEQERLPLWVVMAAAADATQPAS